MGTPPRVDVRARSSVLRQASACAVVSDDGRLNKNYPVAAASGAFYCSDIEMYYSHITILFHRDIRDRPPRAGASTVIHPESADRRNSVCLRDPKAKLK